MVRFTFWLQFLLLVLVLRHSDTVSDQCSELQNEIPRSEENTLKRITELEHRFEILEQLKTKNRVSEAAFWPFKLEEYGIKSKFQQSEGVISSFEKQLEENDGGLQSNNKKQVQLHTAIDGLAETVQSLYRTAQVLCDKQKQMQATIDSQTKTEETNNRTVKELLEKQRQFQATIDDLKETVETLNQTVRVLCENPKYVCRNLFEAAKSGDVNTVKILFKCTNENCATDDQYRETLLIYTSLFGHVGVVRVLLEGGANVEKANANQWTALHAAAWKGHLELCRLLLDWGAKVDPVDKWGDTPLHVAARWGHLSVVQLLVERGADVRVRNNNGQTATDVARIEGKLDVAGWLDSLSRG